VNERSLCSVRSCTYFQPVKRAYNRKDMTGFRSFNNSTYKRILNLLETGCQIPAEVVVKRITVIKFRVNDGGGNVTNW